MYAEKHLQKKKATGLKNLGKNLIIIFVLCLPVFVVTLLTGYYRIFIYAFVLCLCISLYYVSYELMGSLGDELLINSKLSSTQLAIIKHLRTGYYGTVFVYSLIGHLITATVKLWFLKYVGLFCRILAIVSFFAVVYSLLKNIFSVEFKIDTIGPKVSSSNFRMTFLYNLNDWMQAHKCGDTVFAKPVAVNEPIDLINDFEIYDNFIEDLFKLLAAERDFFILQDLQPALHPADVTKCFLLFASEPTAKVNFNAFRNVVESTFAERKVVKTSVEQNDMLVDKMGTILKCILGACAAVVVSAQFDFDIRVWTAGIGSAFIGIGFLMQETFKDWYKIFSFVFWIHPYDIGDMVRIEDQDLKVLAIGFVSTTFELSTGSLLYRNNVELCSCKITNVTRSNEQVEHVRIKVAENDFSAVWELRKRLERSDAIIGLENFELSDNLKVDIVARFKWVLDTSSKIKRKSLFIDSIKESAREIGLELRIQ